MDPAYSNALPVGTRLGAFEITKVLGAGSFGITYQAMDHTLQRMVAIKEYLPAGIAGRQVDQATLSPLSESDRESFFYGLKRFLDEARTVARFNAPSIVRISQFMEANGTAYFIMDYVEGQPLDSHMKCGQMNEENLREVLVSLLKGLRVVHENKYLHRDIKPGNIYIRKDGSPILLDFGCARQRVESATQLMTTMGTPAYAPFEQFNDDESQSPATDLYSLGATLFHCITNKPPTACSARIAALHEERPDPIDVGFELASNRFSPEFLETLYWMLQPFPSDRPQSADEVLANLGVSGSTGSVAAAPRHTPIPSPRETLPTGPLTPDSIPVADWAEEPIQQLQELLARHVGPLAGTLISQAAKKTRQLDTLLKQTAAAIDDLDERNRYLRHARRLMSPADTPAQGSTGTLDTSDLETSIAPAGAAAAPQALFSEQKLQQVQEILAEYACE